MVEGYLPVSAVAVKTRVPRLHLLPSNILLAGAEFSLRDVRGKELILGEQLRSVSRQYDLCVIDCSPSLGILMLNALVAGTEVIVPVQAHFYALDGLKRLLDTIRVIRTRFYPCCVRPLGLLLTFMEDRTGFEPANRGGPAQALRAAGLHDGDSQDGDSGRGAEQGPEHPDVRARQQRGQGIRGPRPGDPRPPAGRPAH